MSRYYTNYTQYLGSQRCCDLRGQGPKGDTGPTGASAIGQKGPKGDTGYTGPTGPRGDTGSDGVTGPRGFTGSDGVTGPRGFTGSDGMTGPKGDTGSDGMTGPKGDTGSDGVTGPRGFTGGDGMTGPKGDTGSDGVTGPRGFTGSDGMTGPKGDTGSDGVTGPRGFTGSDGVTGPRGVTGSDGVTGPKGDTGSDGVTGPRGFTGGDGMTGPRGFTGSDGMTGPKGDTGSDGVTGPRGFTGSDGMTGPRGFTGSDGVTGPRGFTGSDGMTGPRGFTGSDGMTGPKGDTGSDGMTGPKGDTGSDGMTGPKGDTGSDGVTGPRGETGPAGTNNTINLEQVLTNGNSTGNLNIDMSGNELLNVNSITNIYYNLKDLTTKTTDGSIYANSNTFIYDNNINGGSHEWAVNDTSGNQIITLTMNSSTATFNTGVNFNTTSSEYVKFSDYNDSSKYTEIFQNGGSLTYKNQVDNGSINFYSKNSGGTSLQILGLTNSLVSVNATDLTLTTTNSPTCSAVQPTSSDNSTKIPTTAWVQSAISSVINPSYNNITINSLPNNSVIASTGITNQINANGYYSQSLNNYDFTLYGSTGNYTPNRSLKIQFKSETGANPSLDGVLGGCAFDLECFFYNSSSNWGQTSCKIVIFPSALTTNWGTGIGDTTYNINNQINGNGNFVYTDSTHAPNGRQYWTYNQTFIGGSGSHGYLTGANLGGGVYQITIYFLMPFGYNVYYWIKNLVTNSSQTYGNGVLIYS